MDRGNGGLYVLCFVLCSIRAGVAALDHGYGHGLAWAADCSVFAFVIHIEWCWGSIV